jgi:alkanesulfonate monooxygenase SsuD/methylene tetrahydromethanopterin reductase-like flavin-dependent oxidoreductase (luciferase family)
VLRARNASVFGFQLRPLKSNNSRAIASGRIQRSSYNTVRTFGRLASAANAVSLKAGKYHTIEDAGINPLPLHRKVPIWFGGHAEVTMQRVVKWGDGWMPLNYGPGDEAVAAFDKLRAMAEAAGRDPASIGIDTRTTVGIGAEVEWRETVRFWKSCGVTHLTLGTYSGRGHLRRIEGRTLGDHLAAIKRYWNAVADLL